MNGNIFRVYQGILGVTEKNCLSSLELKRCDYRGLLDYWPDLRVDLTLQIAVLNKKFGKKPIFNKKQFQFPSSSFRFDDM